LRSFPKAVRSAIGQALWAAQLGQTHIDAKPLKGFKGSGVVEIVADHDGDTYRGVYTLRLEGVVYVLHAFQKKSKTGIKTPKREIEIVRERLKTAEAHHREKYSQRIRP
jgi:phage-related protein